jgi:hypothetical protein
VGAHDFVACDAIVGGHKGRLYVFHALAHIDPPASKTRASIPICSDMRAFVLIIPLLVILALTAWWAAALWTSIEGAPMPTSGHVAMWLGIILSMLVGCGLMALMFFSSRRGYDDRASRHDIDRP